MGARRLRGHKAPPALPAPRTAGLGGGRGESRRVGHRHEGDCAHPGGPVWKPDRDQGEPEGSRDRRLWKPLSSWGGCARPLLRAFWARGAGLGQPPTPHTPAAALPCPERAAAERRRARSGRGTPRISALPVAVEGFGKYRNQTGLTRGF